MSNTKINVCIDREKSSVTVHSPVCTKVVHFFDSRDQPCRCGLSRWGVTEAG